MQHTTAEKIQEAFELIKTGKNAEARNILLPIVSENPNSLNAWYLLGFTVTDPLQKADCFQQVLRIDPSNQAARKQLAQISVSQRAVPNIGTYDVDSFDTSKSTQKTASKPDQKKSATAPTKLPKMAKIAIAIVGGLIVLALFGMGALYFSNGMSTSNQVNALFEQGKCDEVVQYNTFENSFPRGMFSSTFGVYNQVEECQAKLALAEKLTAQDWPGSYDIIINYQIAHPNGKFLGEMYEQAGNVLLAWSNNLFATQDYDTAIKKLETIQSAFPSSSAAPAALTTMYNDYLIWGNQSFKQKDYENAERVLKIVGWDSKASPDQVKLANQGLAAVYLEWAKVQIENGEYNKGLESYDHAKELNPTLADFDRLKAQAPLIQADALVKASDFDGALAFVDELLKKPLSETAKADTLAEQAKIMNAYSFSHSTQAKAQMTANTSNICKRQQATILPIFGTDPNSVRFTILAPLNLQLSSDWTARSPSELHYVLCVDASHSSIQTCGSKKFSVERYRYVWDLRLYDSSTGVLFKTTKILGSKPGDCDQAVSNDLYGNPPKIQQAIDWLATLDLSKNPE